jgi:hypothetical protein
MGGQPGKPKPPGDPPPVEEPPSPIPVHRWRGLRLLCRYNRRQPFEPGLSQSLAGRAVPASGIGCRQGRETDRQHGEPVHRERIAGLPRPGQRGIPPRQPSNREKSLIFARRREPPLLCMFREPVEPLRHS